MNLLRRVSIGVSFLSVLFVLAAGSAWADKFVALPKLDAKAQNLQIRFVRYDGAVNGGMVVDVKNVGRTSERFVADGLFFVPTGDPEQAPQRQGAAGPFQELQNGKAGKHQEVTTLAPGETKRLSLATFCIDSHRGSPGPTTQFTVAKDRLPKRLRQEMQVSNQRILHENGGDVSKAKPAIQSNMWNVRDKAWIKLEGERKNEKSAHPHPQTNQAPMNQAPIERLPIQRQQSR